jgi:hypothetical protein
MAHNAKLKKAHGRSDLARESFNQGAGKLPILIQRLSIGKRGIWTELADSASMVS